MQGDQGLLKRSASSANTNFSLSIRKQSNMSQSGTIEVRSDDECTWSHGKGRALMVKEQARVNPCQSLPAWRVEWSYRECASRSTKKANRSIRKNLLDCLGVFSKNFSGRRCTCRWMQCCWTTPPWNCWRLYRSLQWLSASSTRTRPVLLRCKLSDPCCQAHIIFFFLLDPYHNSQIP